MMNLLNQLKTRAYLKFLWLRYAYPFNWAHKPLCSRFSGEYLRIGNLHLCRSCTLLWLELITVLIAWFIFGHYIADHIIPIFTIYAAVTLTLSAPRWYKKWPRWFRDLLRAMLGATLALYLALWLSGHYLAALIATIFLAAAWKFYLHRRQQLRHKLCHSCPHLQPTPKSPNPCPGFTYQYQRLSQYQKLATDYLYSNQPSSPPF